MSQDALFQLGMGLDSPKTAQKEDSSKTPIDSQQTIEPYDYFVEKRGVRCAGSHYIIDLYGAKHLNDIDRIEHALIDCIAASGATLLHMHLHPFEPNGGISGVAVLAESHISIHSWPERDYAALDIFMCGHTQPEKCIGVLEKAFSPDKMLIKEILRGRVI